LVKFRRAPEAAAGEGDGRLHRHRLCDPWWADTAPGLNVPEAIADVMRDQLLPMADIATTRLN